MELSTAYQVGQLLAMVILATLFVVMIKADVKVLRVQMDGINENLKVLNTSFTKLSEVLSKSDVLETRLCRAEDDIRELRHGRGFVQRDVNGEYEQYGKTR